jgi:hypothetical protein
MLAITTTAAHTIDRLSAIGILFFPQEFHTRHSTFALGGFPPAAEHTKKP